MCVDIRGLGVRVCLWGEAGRLGVISRRKIQEYQEVVLTEVKIRKADAVLSPDGSLVMVNNCGRAWLILSPRFTQHGVRTIIPIIFLRKT
jgi:hypothetical protein